MVPKMVPKATKMTKMTKTVQGISSDIAPNGYKGFGGNPRQDWDQEKGGVRLRNPVLYPPELQGQELPKALPTKSLQRHPVAKLPSVIHSRNKRTITLTRKP